MSPCESFFASRSSLNRLAISMASLNHRKVHTVNSLIQLNYQGVENREPPTRPSLPLFWRRLQTLAPGGPRQGARNGELKYGRGGLALHRQQEHCARALAQASVRSIRQRKDDATRFRRLRGPALDLLSHPASRARQHDGADRDRKSTRLNSSHSQISYAVFCLKKKKNVN